MALTPQQIAVELNRLQSQGLTLEQAEKQVPGASALINSQGLTVSDNGTVEVFTTGATKTTGQNYTAADNAESAREESTYRTGASTSTTFTNEQVSTSGGGVTTTTVTPTTYKDTPASQTLQAQANAAGLEKEAYAQSLRDQGKSGAQILRDPTYRELSAKQTSLSNQAADAKTPVGGEVTTTYQAGPSETINSTTVTSSVTNSQVPETAQTRVTTEPEATRQQVAAIDSGDSAVNTTKIAGAQGNNTLVQTNTVQGAATASSDVSTNTAQPRSVNAPVNPALDSALSAQQSATDTGGVSTQTLESNFAVTDTGGVPVDSLANIDGDTGFVPEFVGPPSPPPGADPQANTFVFDPISGELIPADSAQAQAILNNPVDHSTVAEIDPYTAIGDRELSEEEQQEQDNPIDYSNEVEVDPYTDVYSNVEEEEDLERDPDAIDEIVVGPDGSLTTVTRARGVIEAEAETLRQAQALQELRAKYTNEDWRLRIRLAPNASYLYRAASPGILQPLQGTNGVVFPYTPTISTSYRANYDAYELVHTNYKGYFYKNSSVQEISVTGVFTANSAAEADYMLAVIHFFRSASKMFYGQDSNPVAGTPPPVLYLDGLGVYQFNEHPCLLSAFNYNLPADVDYIRAGGARNYSGGAVNLAGIRNQQGAASNSLLSSTLSRLSTLKNTFDNFITPGAKANNPTAQQGTNYYGIAGQPTYVPTKIDISITLLPLISRAAQAQSFSLKDYATGQGLREQGFF